TPLTQQGGVPPLSSLFWKEINIWNELTFKNYIGSGSLPLKRLERNFIFNQNVPVTKAVTGALIIYQAISVFPGTAQDFF
ncbi:MAG: hypothetical protein IJU51_06820, partial [Clostridia bacterium]|nr:hypothetical protein [Clostridia bacterium]